MPPAPGAPPLPDQLANRILHMSLPVNEHFVLMGSDTLPGMDPDIVTGTNFTIMIDPESLEEARRLFDGLSAGGLPFTSPNE